MKVSLVFSLIVQATLPLMQKTFFDSVNLIIHRCDKKTPTNISMFTAETNNKVTSVVNFIPSKFRSLPQEMLKVVLLTGLNVHRDTSGGSWFVTNSMFVCYKWS